MAPPRAACDPAAVPGCTHSCSAESALFQGLILNLCFSHPPQALSSFGLVLVSPPPPPAFSNHLLCSPGCQIISLLPAPPRMQLSQKRLAVSLQLTHCFLFHCKSNNSPLAEPCIPHLSMLFGGKRIPQDEVVLQPACRGCTYRESLHRVA